MTQYPFIFVRSMVPFPDTEITLAIGRKNSIDAINHALTSKEKRLLLVSQRNSEHNSPAGIEDMYLVGTVCVIEHSVKLEDTMKISCRSLITVHIKSVSIQSGIQIAEVSPFNLAGSESVVDIKVAQEMFQLLGEWDKAFRLEEGNFTKLKERWLERELLEKALERVWNFSPLSLTSPDTNGKIINVATRLQSALDQHKGEINYRVALRQAILEAEDYKTKLNLTQKLIREEIAFADSVLR